MNPAKYLIILALSIPCLAQDLPPDLAKLQADHQAHLVELDNAGVAQLIEYRDKHFKLLPVVQEGRDPRQSEVVTARNTKEFNKLFTSLITIYESPAFDAHKFDIALSRIAEMDRIAKEMGIAAPAAVAPKQDETKKKGKITATLSDGTQVGD